MSDDLGQLSSVTFGELFRIRDMGVLSVLDFALAVESMDLERSNCVRSTEASTPNEAELDEASQQLLLKTMEAPWAEAVSARDPRFAGTIPKLEGTIAQQLDRIFDVDTLRSESVKDARALARSLPAIEERARAIGGLPLDLAMRQFISAISRTRGIRLEALLARVGFGADPPITLQEAADRIGTSRERFRQIQEDIPNRLPPHPVLMPALDRALEVLARIAPVSAEIAAARLVEERISTIPFHPLNVLAAAALCRRAATFRLEEVKGRTFVYTDAALSFSNALITLASRKARSTGAANVADVVAAAEKQGISIAEQDLKYLLLEAGRARFMGEDWFSFPSISPGGNRLINVARAILSVSPSVNVAAVRRGVQRRCRFHGLFLIPPRSVIAEFLSGIQPFILAEDGTVTVSGPLDYRKELGPSEQILVEVLRSTANGILDRESLARSCLDRGMNINTLSVLTTYSPILDHPWPDIWSLAGSTVEPASVEALRQAKALRPRIRRVVYSGWRPTGEPWLGFRLPRLTGSVQLFVPAAVSRFVAGRRFSASADDDSDVGTITVDERGASWGYTQFLRRSGADEDDILLVTFDLEKSEATLALATDESLEELGIE